MSSDDRSWAARARRLGRARTLRWSDFGDNCEPQSQEGTIFQYPLCDPVSGLPVIRDLPQSIPTNKRIVMLAGLICDWLWNSSECTFASRRVSQFKPGTLYPTNNRLCKLRPQFPGLNYDSWTEGLYFKMVPIVMLTRLTSHGVPRNAFILRGSLPLSLWDL